MRLRKLSAVVLALIVAVSGVLFINPSRAFADPLTCSWTGGGSDTNFTTPENWTGCNGGGPSAGDDLVFGYETAANKTPNNNTPANTAYGWVVFDDGGFTLSGNSLIAQQVHTGGGSDTDPDVIQPQITVTGPSGQGSYYDVGNGAGVLVANHLTVACGFDATIGSWHSIGSVEIGLLDGCGTSSVADIGPSVTIDSSGGGINTMNINNDFTTNGTLTAGQINIPDEITLTGGSSSSISGTVEVNSGGTFVANGITGGQIDVNNGGTFTAGSTSSVGSTVNVKDGGVATLNGGISGTVNVASGGTFTVGSTANMTSTLNVNSGSITVVDGTVSGRVNVNNGGILKGTGTAGNPLVVAQGGTLAPGHSPGCLTASTVSISGTYQEEIGGATTPCTDYDQLVVTGTVNLTNGTLDIELVNGFTPAAGQVFKIIDNQGISPVLGTFSGLPEGTTVHAGGYDYKISYVGGDGNDVTLTALGPTPGAAGSAAAAPGAPNTGLGVLTGHPLTTLAITTAAALMIAIIARRLRPETATGRS